MNAPNSLSGLQDLGVIDEVVRPLMSGKEAQVFLVARGGEHRVAKVYKEANDRSFKNRVAYTEGRRVRNTRRQRAMDKRTRYGRAQEEEAWMSAEVDAIYRLSAAGVRVPQPYHFIDGVFVMELIADAHGEPAPRLVDVTLTGDEARSLFQQLVREVVRMLCAGLVHGDLSDFNVLLSADGPVIIDFPQAVDAAKNNNARKLLIRDVNNLQRFLSRFAPELRKKRYGQEIWALYDAGKLEPNTPLTGRFKNRKGKADTTAVLREIEAAELDEHMRRDRLGLAPHPPRKNSRRNLENAARLEAKRVASASKMAQAKPTPTTDLLDDLDALLIVGG